MQNKYLNDFELLERVRQAVLRRKCSVTVGDIIAETGLNHDDARAALTALMATHEGTMHVSDKGELVYVFTAGCALRDERTWWERNKKTVMRIIKTIFKVVMAAILVIYFVIFLVFALFFFLRLNSGRRRTSFDSPTANFDLAWLIYLFWGKHTQSYEARWNGEEKMPIYERFYQFVFGPEREEEDPLTARARCAQLIRAKKGIITVNDWLMVSGQPLKDCENDLARFTAEFNGTVEILENGTLCYCFEDLMKSSRNEAGQQTAGKPPEKAWNDLEQPYSLCGKESSLVIALNTFNLIMSLIFMKAGPWIVAITTLQNGQDIHKFVDQYAYVTTWLGSVPLVFSLLIFCGPLLRYPANRAINRVRRAHAVRKAVLSPIFAPSHSAPRFTLQQAFQAVSTCFRRANLDQPGMDEVSRELNTLSQELDAERDVESYAYYNFRSFYEKACDVAQEREKRALDNQAFGEVAFSSDCDEQSDIDHTDAVRAFDRELGEIQVPPVPEDVADHPDAAAAPDTAVQPPLKASQDAAPDDIDDFDRELLGLDMPAQDASGERTARPNFLDSLKEIPDAEYDRVYGPARKPENRFEQA
ncbi:MAG: hypothetical protein IKY83_12265 [Proteobacteria bacterium]|nr:hypothetical protein [Pseudomonadota bacterium]